MIAGIPQFNQHVVLVTGFDADGQARAVDTVSGVILPIELGPKKSVAEDSPAVQADSFYLSELEDAQAFLAWLDKEVPTAKIEPSFPVHHPLVP